MFLRTFDRLSWLTCQMSTQLSKDSATNLSTVSDPSSLWASPSVHLILPPYLPPRFWARGCCCSWPWCPFSPLACCGTPLDPLCQFPAHFSRHFSGDEHKIEAHAFPSYSPKKSCIRVHTDWGGKRCTRQNSWTHSRMRARRARSVFVTLEGLERGESDGRGTNRLFGKELSDIH